MDTELQLTCNGDDFFDKCVLLPIVFGLQVLVVRNQTAEVFGGEERSAALGHQADVF